MVQDANTLAKANIVTFPHFTKVKGIGGVQDEKNAFFHFKIYYRPTFLLSKMGSLAS